MTSTYPYPTPAKIINLRGSDGNIFAVRAILTDHIKLHLGRDQSRAFDQTFAALIRDDRDYDEILDWTLEQVPVTYIGR